MLTYDATLADGTALPTWLRFDRAGRAFSGTPADADVGKLSVTVTATDQAGASASTTFGLGVANVNDPPRVAQTIPDQTATQDAAFRLVLPAGTFADADLDKGDVLTLSASRDDGTPLPAWLVFDPATGTLSGTPADADVGSLAVSLSATDRSGASASDTFSITVANVNDPPKLVKPTADQAATQGVAFSLVLTADMFSDLDLDKGDHLTISASRKDGTALPGWLHFDTGRLAFTGTPADADVGALPVVVTATDRAGASISDTFDIVVANTNDPPSVAQHIPDQAAREDSPFGFVVPAGTFADIDLDSGDVLTLSASREDGTPLPAWLAFDPASGTLSGTPVTEDVGSLAIRVTATDSGGLTASDSFSLRVAHTNHAPTVVTPIGTQTATEKSAFNFAFPADTFADRDQGDSLKFDATLADGTPLPAWLRFDKGNRSFGGTPGNADVGSLSIAVIATDGAGLSVTDTFSLVVANVNDPPTLALPIPDQAATQGQPFGFAIPAGTFADPDTASGDTLSLEAKLGDGSALPAWLVFDPASGTLSGTPGDLDVGSLGVTVTATDSGALSVSDTFTISVANVNDPPVISDPVPDQLATENQAFSYSVAIDAFSDAPSDVAAGDTLSYAASRDDGTPLPAWLTFDALTRTFSGTPAKADVGSVGIMITATDKAGASGSDTFAISVIASHDDPTAPAVSLRRGKTASATGAIPVLVDWSAGLEAQGAARPLYHLQVRTAKGTTWGAWKDYATARGRTSVLKTLLPGHLQLRIQVAGAKPGPWVEAAPFLLSLVQDKDPAVSYSGDWSSVSDKNTSGGSIHRSGQPGASVSITTPDAETIALVMPTGPALGIAQVCIDPGTAGQNCRVLDLSLQATAARRLAMQFTGLAPGAHTLTLTVSRGVVAIDAFIVMGQPEPIVP